MVMKKIFMILSCVILMVSCTENLSPNIDYGTQTYINDYSTLSKLLEEGLAKVKLSIDEQTGAIKVQESSINTTLLDGFSLIQSSIDSKMAAIVAASTDIAAALETLKVVVEAQGGKIIMAINESGKILAIAINDQNDVIAALQVALVDAIKANTTTLFDIIKSGNADAVGALGKLGIDLIAAIQNDDQDLLNELKKANANIALLVEMQDAVRLVNKDADGKYEKMYIDPDKWTVIKANNVLETIYLDLLKPNFASQPDPTQYVCATQVEDESETHQHSVWEYQSSGDPKLLATGTVTLNEYTSTVVQNVCTWTKYKLTIDGVCAFPNVFSVKVTDAKGSNRQVVGTADGPTAVYNGQSDYGIITIWNYWEATSTFVSETSAKVYSSEN